MTDSFPALQWNPPLDSATSTAILALIDSAVADGGTLGHAEPMSPRAASAFIHRLARRIGDGDTHVLLGRVGQEAAFLVMMTPSGMPNCRHTAELSKGVVHPAWRGHRLVERAFGALVERADSLGIEQFVLDVREGSRAHALWQRFGFASYGVLEDYARVDGLRHRGHFMVQSVADLRRRLGLVRLPESALTQEEGSHAA